MTDGRPGKWLSLRDRIDAFCALIGIWGGSILKYVDNAEHNGLADYSDILDILEIAELSDVLALPLLAAGVAGSGRVFYAAWRSLPANSRLARSGLLPRR
ncbi:MAG TPA: hypothetical protein VFS63_07895 [Pseudolabrys sp.]|jgi:hypothetical protein|nr:hypothetical protein [Pseudolabrys sp.]